jgi:transposase InsO family protein
MISECQHAYENQNGEKPKSDYKKGKKMIMWEVHYTVIDGSESETGEESDGEHLSYPVQQTTKQGCQTQNNTSRIVMFTENKTELNRFTNECLNHGALDTCCTSCVAGAEWVKIYLNALTPDLRKLVKGPTESNKQFLFGNQGTLNSAATYHIPIKVGGKLKMLEIDCIKSDIPLLISMAAMRDLGMVLDLKHDSITIDGKPIPVIRTSAGHYTIDLLDNKDKIPIDEIFMINENHEQVNLVDLLTADEKTQVKLLDKIHKQFGHRPKDAYIQVLKNANKWLEKFSPMLDSIINKCEGYIMRSKTPDRPVVALPLATDFNQVVTMDLKIWNQNKHEYIFYLIDAFTRYQVATVINRKTPDQVINAIFEKWIQYFGIPDKVLSDNGGEFSNAEMQEVANRINLKLFTTGAQSPWQNGICERNHAHTDNILQSVLRDYPQLSLKSALTWACTAKNSLTTIHGYSPFQLVFGRNIRLPNILNDPPPTYEIKTMSKALADNLAAIHATREAHMKAESCEKLKRALKSKVRTFDHIYHHGDYVYYKRDRQDGWEGPGRVVFQDNKIILVRQGGFFYKVSANRIKPAHDDLVKELDLEKLEDFLPSKYNSTSSLHNNKTKSKQASTTTTKDQEIQNQTISLEPFTNDNSDTPNNNQNVNNDEDNDSETDNSEQNIPISNNDENSDTEYEQAEENAVVITESPQGITPITPRVTENPTTITESSTTNTENSPRTDNTPTEQSPHNNNDSDSEEDDFVESLTSIPRIRTRNATKQRLPKTIPKPVKFRAKDRIEIKEKNRWERGIILNPAGKASGKYKDWYNIKLDNGKTFNTNVRHRDIRKLTNEEAMLTWVTQSVLAVMVPRAERNSEACNIAKQQELDKLKEFDTYQIVDDKGQDRITTTWVLTEKADTVRARLTCRGFQEEDDFPTDSPTIQKSSVRMILTIAATSKWNIRAIDIKSAFLQGDKLTRKVFVKPPKESNLKNKLWRLKKCLYGLKDASRQWYLRLKTTLKKNKFQKSIYDGGLFFIIENNTLIGVVGIHVDDFLAAGTDHFMKVILTNVLKEFLVGKAEDQTFMYTGTKITQDDQGITVDQTEYVQNLEIFDLDPEKLRMNRLMDQTEMTNLRQYCGSLNWAVGTSRPDLSFQMIDLSTNFKGGKVSALKKAHSVMKQLKKKTAYIRISHLNNFNDCELWCYSDAAHRNLNDGTDSAGGYILFVVNIKNGSCAPIEWRSNKIKRRVVSTLAAELLSLATAIDSAIGIRDQLCEITAGKVNLKIKAITDNRSARDTIYSEKANDQKRLRAEIAGIKESIELGLLDEVKWVPGVSMLADILTKQGVKSDSLMSVLQKGQMGDNLLNAITK